MKNELIARLVGTTNEKMKKYIGEVRHCYFNGNNLTMIRDDGHYISTSKVEEMVSSAEDLNKIIVKTLNSIYELEIIEEVK